MRARVALVLASCLGAVACDASETTLVVQVRTDLAPGRDFSAIRVTTDFSSTSAPANAHRDWGSGVRVAELTGLTVDALRVEVAALDAAGAVVVARPVRVELAGGVRVVTVLLTRDCAGVVCPGPGDPEAATACVAGRCAEDTCTLEDATSCPGECATDAECAGGSACATAGCVAGSCFVAPDHGACSADAVCDVAAGCVPVTPSGPLAPRGPGHALLSVEWDDGRSHVLRVALDGSGRTEDLSEIVSSDLGREPTGLFDSNAAASRDGRWIGFVDTDYGLVRVDVDGVLPPRAILPGVVYAELAATWIHESGDELLYVDGSARGWGLYRAFDDGGGFRASPDDLAADSPHPYNHHPVSRGPDELVFLCGPEAFFGAGLCSMARSGGPVRELHPPAAMAEVYVSGPAVEADGDLLITETDPASSVSRVYRIPAAGGPATPITDFAVLADPCALPDGRWLVLERGPPILLWVMRDDVRVDTIDLQASLAPGVARAYLTSCSP